MIPSSKSRFIAASLFVLALSLFSTSISFGALNMYLKLKGANGKSYIAKPDESGNFTFSNVEPGTYKLLFVGDPRIFESAPKGTSMELQSFSWGATNSGSMSSGSGAAGKESSAASTSETSTTKPLDSKEVKVAAGDLNGDGRPDIVAIPSPKKISYKNPKVEGSEYCTIVLENIVVASACSPSGKVGGWNLKENVK